MKKGDFFPLITIEHGETFDIIVLGRSKDNPDEVWKLISKKKSSGKIEAVWGFGRLKKDGSIEFTERVYQVQHNSKEDFNTEVRKIIKELNSEVRILNLSGLTIEQAMNRIKESDFAKIIPLEK